MPSDRLSKYPNYSSYLKTDGNDFPTPISQIPKVEKNNNMAINVYGFTISKKMEKVNIFPYHISEQPKEMQRINLHLISEDIEIVSEDTDDNDEGIINESYDPDADCATGPQKETKYHYCWIKNLNRLLSRETCVCVRFVQTFNFLLVYCFFYALFYL